jgi:hypothetical protein
MGAVADVYILNLYGNIRKGETDKNIFDNYNVGIVIHYCEKGLLDLKKDFSILNNEDLREKYKNTKS